MKKRLLVFLTAAFLLQSVYCANAATILEDGYALYEPDDMREYASYASASAEDPGVDIRAKSAVLMDQTSGKVLIEHHPNDPVYPASVTKIMSLLLIAEAIDNGDLRLTDSVTTSPNAASKGGSQIWLKEGETMTVEELLKATAVYSANDACTALGEAVAGSSEAFVEQMNERASELGMQQTHFVNCTGLDDDTTEHLTSAYDVALMSKALLDHAWITRYTTIWMDSLRGGETELVNTNKLIRFYEGATGLKTGTTNKAGCCVSASAKRGQTHLIAVVMGSDNSKDRFETAKNLLNWGFAHYETVVPKIDADWIRPVRVLKGVEDSITPVVPQTLSVLIPKGKADEIQQQVDLTLDVQAPVEKGQKLGAVTLTLNGEVLGEYRLTAPEAVAELTVPILFRRMIGIFAS